MPEFQHILFVAHTIPCMAYPIMKTIKINQKCRQIYQSHGSYGLFCVFLGYPEKALPKFTTEGPRETPFPREMTPRLWSERSLWRLEDPSYVTVPIPSMYGISTYIWLIFMVNVGKYTIHGCYGVWIAACQYKAVRDEISVFWFSWRHLSGQVAVFTCLVL